MKSRTVETSPQVYARTGGVLYLVIIAAGMFAELFVRERLVVARDPAATAANILGHELLYRLGFAADVLVVLCAVALLFILFRLLERVDRNLALLMVFFNLVSIAIQCASLLYHYEPLILLKGTGYLSAFTPDQLQALAYERLRVQSVGYDLALAVFGLVCIFIGGLIIKSTFFPRLLGVLMVIAGPCYLINSFVHFLAPQRSLFPYIMVPCLVAELSLTLWLLVKGVNLAKWEARMASVAGP